MSTLCLFFCGPKVDQEVSVNMLDKKCFCLFDFLEWGVNLTTTKEAAIGLYIFFLLLLLMQNYISFKSCRCTPNRYATLHPGQMVSVRSD